MEPLATGPLVPFLPAIDKYPVTVALSRCLAISSPKQNADDTGDPVKVKQS